MVAGRRFFVLTSFFSFDILEKRLYGMDKSFLIQLTNNLYRLTLFFPKKEPLRYKMREVADDILAKPSEKNLEILENFFEVAKSQNWVRISDLLAIQKEYANLREELKKAKPEKKKGNPNIEVQSPYIEVRPPVMSERQEKILTFLKENGRAQVWQVKQILPEVTKRTLRRDFEHLLKQGIIERIGEKNNTFYQIRTVRS
jgi:Fic family protein